MVFVNLLTEQMVSDGKRLTKLLERNFAVNASLWFYDSELNTWRLIIASSDVRTFGPRWVYSKIRSILYRNLHDVRISLNSISVVDDRDPLIISLRSAIGRHGVSGMRLSANAVNGVFIEDVLIYKL
jgi:hypothetical protein